MSDEDMIRRGDALQLVEDYETIHDRISLLPAVTLPDVAGVVEAASRLLGMVDALIAESGRSIEWGEEDPFRMGEWFEPEDLAQIEQARAALAKIKEPQHG